MAPYLNTRQYRLRVPLSFDLSSELDRIISHQTKGIGFHLVVAEGALSWCPSGPATEADKHHSGNI